MFRKFKNTAGFTMAEILLTTFIIGVMAVSYISAQDSASSRKNRSSFKQEVNSLNANFRALRNYAISNTTFDTNGDGIATVPEGNFGIYINETDKQFVFFIDTNDGSPEGGAPNLQYDYTDDANDANDDYIITNLGNAYGFFDLANTSKILSIKNEDLEVLTEAAIFFAPSSSDMIINNNNSANSYGELSIVLLSRFGKAEISINKVSKFFVTEFIQ